MARILGQKYGLTKTETEICLFLSTGETQAEVRNRFRYNTNGLKQHLKAIYAKVHPVGGDSHEKYVRLLIMLMKMRYEMG